MSDWADLAVAWAPGGTPEPGTIEAATARAGARSSIVGYAAAMSDAAADHELDMAVAAEQAADAAAERASDHQVAALRAAWEAATEPTAGAELEAEAG